MKVYELNMDGLVGPTHHYAGLSPGNIASMANALTLANPAAAAKQGIEKMRRLHRMGIKQGILPPHPRPNLQLLEQLGFLGTPAEQMLQAKKIAPSILSASFSASSMWAANTATIAPSTDTKDRRVHFTPANLISNLHRHQESLFTGQILKKIFSDDRYFTHHPPLPSSLITSDEGAANHNRLCAQHDARGIHLFVYGKKGLTSQQTSATPENFPARQTLEASEAIARRHQLNPDTTVFSCQNPKAIDQGVFHNDVIAVANESVFLFHQEAFVNQSTLIDELHQRAHFPLSLIEVSSKRITVKEAVNSYLFNSQLVTLPDGKMHLLAPTECLENTRIKEFLDELLESKQNPIADITYLNLKQSMLNGGGPACLRLRICLNENELSAMQQSVLVSEPLLDKLVEWVNKHYRTQLHANDLADPAFVDECYVALDELTFLLNLGAVYSFQRF